MGKIINTEVQVLASSRNGIIIPQHLTWKGKSFTITSIEDRKTHRTSRGRKDVISARIVVLRRIELEYDYVKKTWKLLSAEEIE
jgi:hypothetical protein